MGKPAALSVQFVLYGVPVQPGEPLHRPDADKTAVLSCHASFLDCCRLLLTITAERDFLLCSGAGFVPLIKIFEKS
jgi:hypothetical protein